MKIGVISDTHLAKSTPDLVELMRGPFKDVEMIFHAGDITELEVLEAFAGKEVLAVCGNMDSAAVRRKLPARRVWESGKFKFGLIHGWGRPWGMEERIAREFAGVDCIIYGHTHSPAYDVKGEGVLFFNPGAFGGAWASGSKSVGVLTLGDTISGQIIYL
jgi:hypothetical protein